MTRHSPDQASEQARLSRRRPVVFTLLLFALSVPFWLLGFVVELPPLPINVPLSAVQAFCPLVVALILVRREDGPGSVRALLRRLVDFGGPGAGIWYAPALLLMPITLTISYLALRLMGSEVPDWRMSPTSVVVLAGVFLASAIGEEVGWSGYLIDALRQRRSALAAAVVLGTVWAVWHLVAWYAQSGHTLAWTVGQFAGSVAGRVLMVWLYNTANHAMPVVVLYHTMINVSEFSFPNYGSHYDPVSAAVILVVAAAVVTALAGPRTLAGQGGEH